MPKLTDTQTILLSAAAQRANRSLYPLPDTLTDSGPRVGKALTGLVSGGWADERETDLADAVSRTDGDVRYGLFITAGGLAAIGVEPGGESDGEPAPATRAAPTPSEPRLIKSALVLELLHREQGATLPELIAATGWLPHTTRATLTGLRKKGHAIDRSKRDEVTCYRIPAAA